MPVTSTLLEAIRKCLDIWAKCSCRCLAVVESRAMAWSQSVEHERSMAHVNHRRAGVRLSFIIFTVASVAIMPGVGVFLCHELLLTCQCVGASYISVDMA